MRATNLRVLLHIVGKKINIQVVCPSIVSTVKVYQMYPDGSHPPNISPQFKIRIIFRNLSGLKTMGVIFLFCFGF